MKRQKTTTYEKDYRGLLYWILVFLVCMLIFSRCSQIRKINQESRYHKQVRVMTIDRVPGGYKVIVRSGYMLYQHIYTTLPDSIAIGKTINMPVFVRIK